MRSFGNFAQIAASTLVSLIIITLIVVNGTTICVHTYTHTHTQEHIWASKNHNRRLFTEITNRDMQITQLGPRQLAATIDHCFIASKCTAEDVHMSVYGCVHAVQRPPMPNVAQAMFSILFRWHQLQSIVQHDCRDLHFLATFSNIIYTVTEK